MIRSLLVAAVLGMTSPSLGQDWEIPAWFQESGHIQGWNSPFNLLWEIPPPYEEGLAVRPIVERPFVLGDFGGARTALSKSGWLILSDYTQFWESVVSDGINDDLQYGAKTDTQFIWDAARAGVVPGGVFILRLVFDDINSFPSRCLTFSVTQGR